MAVNVRMHKKTWVILAAVLCVAVLGITIWCVRSGVQSALPKPPEVEEDVPVQVPEFQEEAIPSVDENGNLLSPEEIQVADENIVVNPWGDAPAEGSETSEIPSDSESISNDSDLAVSDEGWTGIY